MFPSPRDQANQYLETKNVHKLFALLGSKIAVKKPDDVNAFILQELKTIQSEKERSERYTLFTTTDIESIFTAFDLTSKGYISQEQYITALVSVGITKPHFPEASSDRIDKKTFMALMMAELSQDAY